MSENDGACPIKYPASQSLIVPQNFHVEFIFSWHIGTSHFVWWRKQA